MNATTTCKFMLLTAVLMAGGAPVGAADYPTEEIGKNSRKFRQLGLGYANIGGLLMAILVLPFSVPVLIFGVSAASAASGGTVPFATPLMILGAMTLASVALAPFAAAAALRGGE